MLRATSWTASRIRRAPLSAFAVLAITFSWLVWIPAAVLVPDLAVVAVVLGAFGPAVAGAVVVAATGGGLRAWLRDMAVWRIPARWWLAALLLPLVIPLARVFVLVGTDEPLLLEQSLARLPTFLAATAVTALVFGGQEELGWRGYLLPRLQRRVGPLAASLLIGALWAAWHLPGYLLPQGVVGGPFVGQPFWIYLAFVMGLSVAFTWLYNGTRGSVLVCMVLHGAVNNAALLTPADPSLLDDPGAAPAINLAPAVATPALAVLLLLLGRRWLRRPALRPDTTGVEVGDTATRR